MNLGIKPIQVPTGDQLCQKQLDHFSQKLIETPIDEVIKPYLPAVQESLKAH